MKVAVDTNILIRYIVLDDPAQAEAAAAVMEGPHAVTISLPVLCELIWTLKRLYDFDRAALLSVLDTLFTTGADVDRSAVESGRRLLAAGGDFADGVIAHQAREAGASILYTFDRRFAQRNDPAVCRVELLEA
ncbi:hypothetical protein C882_2875 [Caenispirillum salinarum AK4]|uniref:Ribonuclease VapC n=1 Tax=Caenispirillum salinarum AK4 TaxID=1238182 RepID=K9HBS0_9PROT|nr:type II toxin-antitoxin system VapC family toxin [Caenispirillum salinarum]EKV26166.1 hypothetical protein C882_2875 [Caenispirillum salinarum AK4]